MGNLEQADSPESKATGSPAEDAVEIEIPEGVPPETRGSKQFALFAFIAIFVAILGSAVLYLASRRSGGGVPEHVQPVQTAQQQNVSAPKPVEPVVVPPPQPAPAVASSTAPPEPIRAPEPVKQPEAAAAPAPVPQAGRWYLQVGSLEKGVAEIMSQGLRIKGIPAVVAPGVTPIVSRILAGPFDDSTQMAAAEKQLREMGFQPFPRKFDAAELREPPPQTAQQAPGSPEAVPTKPDVRR